MASSRATVCAYTHTTMYGHLRRDASWSDMLTRSCIVPQIAYPLLWLGAIGAGGCVAGSNPAYTTSELAHLLKTTEAKYIVAHFDCLTSIREAAAQCHISNSNIFVFGSEDQQLPAGCQLWQTLLNCGESDWKTYKPDGDDYSSIIALLGITSGTTGLPKAAALSHRSLIAQCELMLQCKGKRRYEVCLPGLMLNTRLTSR